MTIQSLTYTVLGLALLFNMPQVYAESTTTSQANETVKTVDTKTATTQKTSLHAIPEVAATVEAFIPKGWKIEQKIQGQLTKEATVVATVVELREEKPMTAEANIQRKLLVLFTEADKKFHRIGLAEKLLWCPSCFGALFGTEGGNAEIKIEKGVLIVDQLRGSNETEQYIQRFRYDAKTRRLLLIGQDVIHNNRGSGDSSLQSTNYLTAEQINETVKQHKRVSTQKTKITVKPQYFEDIANQS